MFAIVTNHLTTETSSVGSIRSRRVLIWALGSAESSLDRGKLGRGRPRGKRELLCLSQPPKKVNCGVFLWRNSRSCWVESLLDCDGGVRFEKGVNPAV
jgi:hypothetical protein